MKNVAFIHNSFPAGGAERVTVDIVRYVSESVEYKEKYKIYVFAVSENSGLFDSSIAECITLKLTPKKAKARSREIERLVKELRIDILVQVVDHIDDIAGIRQRTGVRLIFANHGEPFWQRYSIMSRRQNVWFKKILWHLFWKRVYADERGGKARRMAIERSLKIYQACDAYTVLCEEYRQQTCAAFGISPDDAHIVAIPNSERVRDVVHYQKEHIILYCGRLDNLYKRIDRLLRIWSLVQDRIPLWRLQLVGDGPDRKKLERMAAKLCLKRISFEGVQRNVQQYYDRASILVLTSQSEGWPLCLTEAQASGVVPVAFACSSGVQKILGPDGVNGCLVPCFDEQRFADILYDLANASEEGMQQFRHRIVARAAGYAPEIIATKWVALFDSLLHNSKD